ncbi:MAG: hypothetical protein M3548_24030 [Actinomycetota bacterium]|nr:hypothetical protein [Actinomycetota bacterium]
MVEPLSSHDSGVWRAVDELEMVVARNPGESEHRTRLAHALLAVADDCRSVTRDRIPEITSLAQLAACERVATRLLELAVANDEIDRRAKALLTEVRLGRMWTWQYRTRAAVLAVLAAVLGLGGAVYGGLTGGAGVIVIATVLSSVLLFVVVVGYRRQNWRLRAEAVEATVWREGI